jgi:hypothetical protein
VTSPNDFYREWARRDAGRPRVKGDIVGDISDRLVSQGLEAAEAHISLDDLSLALEHDLPMARFILNRLGQVRSIPRELDCQIHMLRHLIAEAKRRNAP